VKKQSHLFRTTAAVVVILGTVGYLAVTGAQSNKSYYVTISEMKGMGDKTYERHLRVAGNVVPGSIERSGTHLRFVLSEQGNLLKVNYQGAEPPPDTFKDDAQALAVGTLSRDGTFSAVQLQAKCASKYAPSNKPATVPVGTTASLKTSAPSGR
jgi:cytochrome c-type biogenesis protein CcmE